MITITITGDRGQGKTTTAIAIMRMLQSLGMTVNYHGWSHQDSGEIRECFVDGLEEKSPFGMTLHQCFTVVDRHEQEDAVRICSSPATRPRDGKRRQSAKRKAR